MHDLEQASLYLKMAEKDLRAVQLMVDREQFDDEVFGFPAQQGVEKALKACLCLLGSSCPKTHDLEYLSLLADQAGAVLPELDVELAALTSFAVEFRYEPYASSDAHIDRLKILAEVDKLFGHVKSMLDDFVRRQR